MFNVLIADDEPKIRRGIFESIGWDELDMKVTGLARDGVEALEMARSEKPDICLVDICMPLLNGLDLIDRIKEVNPAAVTIIITGYDSFEFAQKALKLKAFDYILKPIKEEELKNILLKAKEEISRASEMQKSFERATELLKKNMPLLRAIETDAGYLPIIRSAKLYIDNHFSDSELCLKEVADKLEVSTGYLSRIFSQYLGMSFSEYLIKTRINEAMKLMDDFSAKIYEIAEKTGYKSQHYFCYAFKKVLGITPSEYKQKGHVEI